MNDIFEEMISKISSHILVKPYDAGVSNHIYRSIYNAIGINVDGAKMSSFNIKDLHFYFIKGKMIDNIRKVNLNLNNNKINIAILINEFDDIDPKFNTIFDIIYAISKITDAYFNLYYMTDITSLRSKPTNQTFHIYNESYKSNHINYFMNIIPFIIGIRVIRNIFGIDNNIMENILEILKKFNSYYEYDERFINLIAYGEGVENPEDLCLCDYSIISAIRDIYDPLVKEEDKHE